MNNSWLHFFIPKVQIKLDSLSQLSQIRQQRVRIYRVRKVEDGYIITIKRTNMPTEAIIRHQSIYRTMAKFVVPIALVWSFLLIAVQFITIDYEIRGNLVSEDVAMVSELIEPHFVKFGPFAFFRGDDIELSDYIAAAFHDYIWIDIQIVGSRLFIDIFDTQVNDAAVDERVVETLYAKRSGVVDEVIATGCRVIVEINQVVHVGEPLITCFTPTGFGIDVAPIIGSAKGKVYAQVWYEIAIEFPREYAVRMMTGSNHSNLVLNLGNSSIRIWGIDHDYEDFTERSSFFNPLSFLNISPFTLERVHYYEKRDIMLENEIESIRLRADDLALNELESLMEGDFTLIEMDFLRMNERDGMIELVYHATVRENIAQ